MSFPNEKERLNETILYVCTTVTLYLGLLGIFLFGSMAAFAGDAPGIGVIALLLLVVIVLGMNYSSGKKLDAFDDEPAGHEST